MSEETETEKSTLLGLPHTEVKGSPTPPQSSIALATVCYLLVWYTSSTFYVTEVAEAAGGQHIGVHILAHAVCYAIANYFWDVLIKKKAVDASVLTFSMAGVFHTAGTTAAVCGIWFISGASTQMIKLMEPIIVLILLGVLNKRKATVTPQQYLGSVLVIATVSYRLVTSDNFQMDHFAFALLISIWYPLRNTVWNKSDRLSSANWSLLLSFVFYAAAAFHFGDLGAVDGSVVYPACLFGTYQLSSLLVLDAVEPQMHSTLNVGKRCVVLFGLFFLSEEFEMFKFVLYGISLLGAMLISCKMSQQKAYVGAGLGFVALAWIFMFSHAEVHGQSSLHSSPALSEPTVCGHRAVVYITDGYIEPVVDPAKTLTIDDACKQFHNGNVGNMVWKYAAVGLFDRSRNLVTNRINIYDMRGSPDLLVFPGTLCSGLLFSALLGNRRVMFS
jgi:hypothetical protein